jgi:hypothetical protein
LIQSINEANERYKLSFE